ncbi:hypothetical protein AAFC00_002964 [Neodothiora populina]|uniref:Store-operated calcium entry-associated regulatory factor n=1 Tax=Neodothiora populina TaxID=2781224 RepID=A0ABR3PA53_9PEZI
MKIQTLLPQVILLLSCHSIGTFAARKPSNSVLLSNIKSLTLRGGKDTTARRLKPVPQLSCVGGNACDLYDIDVMRCTNSGSDYDADNVQWTCKASLPPEFKLGATDVICEGYDSAEDPYILKGSCGVEYRLVLTETGEEKYGHRDDYSGDGPATRSERIMFGLCLAFIVGVIGYGVWTSCTRGAQRPPAGGRGGAGGGWGWGGDDDNDDPPPPYDPRPPGTKGSQQAPNTQGWRPGFWTGTAAGAAGAYMAANRGFGQRTDPMVGSSRSAQARSNSNGSSSSSPPSSARYESTGFGGSRRR